MGGVVTRREAKKAVCSAVAHIISMSAQRGGEWMYIDNDGNELPPADQARMQAAFDELVDELYRRAGE